jgi:hypothetical protein
MPEVKRANSPPRNALADLQSLKTIILTKILDVVVVYASARRARRHAWWPPTTWGCSCLCSFLLLRVIVLQVTLVGDVFDGDVFVGDVFESFFEAGQIRAGPRDDPAATDPLGSNVFASCFHQAVERVRRGIADTKSLGDVASVLWKRLELPDLLYRERRDTV